MRQKSKNKYVEQAIKQIREHYKEDINISTVAEQLQISEGLLSRVFKKETDYTFTTYLSYYRMKVAMELLKEGNLKVYEVADAAGYSDTAYFSAQFKKNSGGSRLLSIRIGVRGTRRLVMEPVNGNCTGDFLHLEKVCTGKSNYVIIVIRS